MKTDLEKNTLEANLLDPKTPKRMPSVIGGGGHVRKSILNRKTSQKKVQLRELNSHKVVFISTMFAMVFSPFNGVQNFLHEMMKENGYESLGLLALAIFYISFGLGSFITPQYSTSCEYKYVFMISFLPMSAFFFSLWLSLFCTEPEADLPFCSSGTIYLVVFGCSIIAGLGTSLLWITKSIYITDCANPFNKAKMFSVFSSIAPWTYLIGPVFTGLVLHDFGAKSLFKVIVYICILTSLMALGVKKPEKDTGDVQLMIELSGLRGGNELGTIEADGPVVQNSGIVIPRMEYYTREFIWKCLTTQKMTIFFPLFLASACNFSIFITYLSSDVFGILKEANTSVEAHFSHEVGMIAWVFLAFGLGEILADRFFSAKVQTNKEAALSMVYKVFIVCAILHLIQHVWMWYPLYLPLAFLYGVGDAGSQEVIGGLISMKFFERFEPFTCFRIVYFGSLGVFFLIHLLFVEAAPVVSFVLFIFLIVFAWLNNYRFFTSHS